jgi:hypothetical protein
VARQGIWRASAAQKYAQIGSQLHLSLVLAFRFLALNDCLCNFFDLLKLVNLIIQPRAHSHRRFQAKNQIGLYLSKESFPGFSFGLTFAIRREGPS